MRRVIGRKEYKIKYGRRAQDECNVAFEDVREPWDPLRKTTLFVYSHDSGSSGECGYGLAEKKARELIRDAAGYAMTGQSAAGMSMAGSLPAAAPLAAPGGGQAKQTCWSFTQGQCTRGSNCRYSHGEASEKSKLPCWYFQQKGFCRDGEKCTLSHGKDSTSGNSSWNNGGGRNDWDQSGGNRRAY